MLFLQMGVVLEEKALFLAPGRPQDWMIQAASVNFDLEEAQKDGHVKLVWIPANTPQSGQSDAMASRAIEDLVSLIKKEQPDRVLINDFMPFLQFRSFDRFRQMFGWMIGQLTDVHTTVLFMMPNIINVQSRQIMEFMRNQMAGSMHVSMPENGDAAARDGEEDASHNSRRLVLWPGLGHVTHEVVDPWEVPILSSGSQSAIARNQAASQHVERQQEREHVERQQEQGRREGTPASFEGGAGTMSDSVSAFSTSIPDVAVDSLRQVEAAHGAFYNKLKKSFKQRASKKYKPFLLVALRMETNQTIVDSIIGLDMLLPAIEKIVLEPDDILVDENRQRIIAFLPNRKDDNVQEFFESIQDKLREEYPAVADQLPHVVSAVVVPNGEPFETPEDFLVYALEGN